MSMIFDSGLSFSGFERNKVFINRPGTQFLDVSDVSGADSDLDCRAACVADFDDDGDPDLFVSAFQRERHLLYRNNLGVATGHRFLKFRLRATSGQHEALGAIVRVRLGDEVQAQVKSAGSGFVSQHGDELIFGLGSRAAGEVEVRWPGGKLERFGKLDAGRYLLVEGSGAARSRTARTFTFQEPLPPGLKVRVGEALPRIHLRNAAGEKVDVSPIDGTLVVNFWATYCASCVKEIPALEKLHRKPGFEVVAISLDGAKSRNEASALLRKRGASFRCLYPAYPQLRGLESLVDLDRLTLPTTLYVDSSGILRRIGGAVAAGDGDGE